MKPVILPALERLGRRSLGKRGLSSRSVKTPSGTLHVYDAKGSGRLPTVVLLHGIGSTATAFGRVMVRLLPHVRRVVAPDYPGHGFSEHEGRLTPEALFLAIRTVLDTLEVEPAVLVGNSLGGAVAFRLAIDSPERVRGLVLLSPAGAHATPEEWAEIRKTFDVTSRAAARVFFDRLYFRSPRVASLFLHEMPAMLARPCVRELFGAATNDNLPGPDELASLPMPILLLWGKHERILPPGNLAFFTRHLPGHAVIERPDGYAHCPHFDDPADVARRIVAFAEKLD